MRKARVLLAIPDRATREGIRHLLDGIAPTEAAEPTNGPDAYQAALALLPDLVVTAAELPGYDGLKLCHMLRGIAQLRDTPVVVVGPRGDQPRKYQAFYVGATEYVELPYDPIELQFRLKIQLRGLLRDRDAAGAIACGGLSLEPSTRTVQLAERRVVLTPSEFSLLRHLATRPNHPFTVDQLLTDALGHPPQLGNPQLIHTHVRNLRKKLEADPQNPALLIRHPAGYMLAV